MQTVPIVHILPRMRGAFCVSPTVDLGLYYRDMPYFRFKSVHPRAASLWCRTNEFISCSGMRLKSTRSQYREIAKEMSAASFSMPRSAQALSFALMNSDIVKNGTRPIVITVIASSRRGPPSPAGRISISIGGIRRW